MLGVLFAFRPGEGVDFPLPAPFSCRAATFAAVGVLKGSRFRGGSLNGCRFFLLLGTAAAFGWGAMGNFRLAVDSGAASCADATGMSFVEELLILLASYAKLGFRLENGVSAGDSLGDSYAFGIAGTGGTSSRSCSAELCTFLVLGVGNLDEVGMFRDIRGCKEPVEVRAEV